MVRVLTAHHFSSQDILTCEEPTALAAVPPDKLLIASPLHTIEVRDLSKRGEVVSQFPTVDLVQHLVYCKIGDYVATLEGPGTQGAVVRVYTHWDRGPSEQPMRARIAGRVTPSLNQGEACLEMIELPLRGGAGALACCQATGNLLAASRRTLSIFRYILCTHDSSRIRYIDFEDTQLSVSLSFVPCQAFLCEELVVCMGKHSLVAFRLRPAGELEVEAEREDRPAARGQLAHQERPLEVARILQFEQEVNSGRRGPGPGAGESWESCLGVPLPVTVQLPSIAAERASRGHCSPGSGVVHHSNPFVSDPAEVSASISGTSDFHVEVLLRLQLAGDPQGGHGEEFGCLALQPLYRRRPGQDRFHPHPRALSSRYRHRLSGVACLVATQQEGYLYHFPMDGSRSPAHPCVAVYPFTAPVSRVVLEPLGLHALTDTGLETYTLRSMHRSLRAIQGVCPPADDPICLIGLRPFLGARHLLASGPYLVLVSTSEGSPDKGQASDGRQPGDPWTLYSLQLPTPEVLFADMVAVGESHRVASPCTYCHLLGEAHCVLAGARFLSPDPTAVREQLEEAGALQALYCESCAHLGDFHILSEDPEERDLAARFYRMSRLPPGRVLERMRRDAEQQRVRHGEEGGGHGDKAEALRALQRAQVHYLRSEVLEPRRDGGDDQSLRQLTGMLLDLLEAPGAQTEAEELAGLVLRAKVLRDFCATRTLHLLRALSTGREQRDTVVTLALLVLEVLQGPHGEPGALESTLSAVQTLPAAALVEELALHPELLVEGHTGLSELAALLMGRRPADMAALLAKLVAANTFSLTHVLKMMLDFLSTQIGSSGTSGSVVSVVFQRFLEAFFSTFYANNAKDMCMDLATEEALKILVRSYLSDLQSATSHVPSSPGAPLLPLLEVLLEAERLPFLNAMPPFAPDLSERLASPVRSAASLAAVITSGGVDVKKLSLKKLQAVLCSGRLPHSCVCEVLRFVRGQPNLVGNLSLQVLCVPVKEATILLLDFCPQALLRYGQDVFRSEEDWRMLLNGLDAKVRHHCEQETGKPLRALYQQTMADVLEQLAHTLSVEALHRVLPMRPEQSEEEVLRAHLHHLHTCQRVASANSVRSYITTTSAAFLTQLDG